MAESNPAVHFGSIDDISVAQNFKMDVHTVLPALTNQLLLELKNLARDETSEEHGHISDELLSALNCVFPTCLSQALDYVDKKAITLVKTPCGRSVFKVRTGT